VTAAKGYIEMLPPYNNMDAFRGMEAFSHIWVVFVFTATVKFSLLSVMPYLSERLVNVQRSNVRTAEDKTESGVTE
jgi:tRNA (Thr-GGU) A37 N-methylase